MFTDLIKAKRQPHKNHKNDDEISDERINELMDALFSKSADDDDDADDDEIDLAKGADEDADADDEDADADDGDAMEKGGREDLMRRAHEMVEGLSEEDLADFLGSKVVKKALVMTVLGRLDDGALRELVSFDQANGMK